MDEEGGKNLRVQQSQKLFQKKQRCAQAKVRGYPFPNNIHCPPLHIWPECSYSIVYPKIVSIPSILLCPPQTFGIELLIIDILTLVGWRIDYIACLISITPRKPIARVVFVDWSLNYFFQFSGETLFFACLCGPKTKSNFFLKHFQI